MSFIKQHLAGFITGIAITITAWSIWTVYNLSTMTYNNTATIQAIVNLINSQQEKK